MARIDVVSQFDQNALNLNTLVRDWEIITFYDNYFFEFHGQIYADAYEIVSVYEGDFYATYFLGSSITVNSVEEVTGGTINALGEAYWDGYEYIPYVLFTGFSLDAMKIYQAALTSNNKDDLDLLRSALGGNDLFELSDFNDRAYGHGGNDKMLGYAGNDSLWGGTGNDSLSGGDGVDKLFGESGKDSLRGGSGKDAFVFARITETGTGPTTADVIADFARGQDKIDLKAIDAYARTGANDAFVWKGAAAFSSATKGEVSFKKFNNAGTSNDYTMVYLDNDGDRTAEGAIRLTGLHNLTASDFIL